MKIIKKIYKKLLLILVIGYVISIFITQQKTLNTYKKEIGKYEDQISQQKETKEDLIAMKENVDSSEYIEKIAREKRGMYLPNERVYIDKEK